MTALTSEMITIKSLASSSSGNCYRIDDGKTPLLLEAGIPIKKIKEGLAFKLSEIRGCLLSHEHGDHSKAIPELMSAGINVYASEGTAQALNIQKHHRCHIVKAKRMFDVCSWRVMPFQTIHDAAEPLGFYLISAETLVFLTDSAYCPVRFPRIDYLMLECNYSDAVLRENVRTGKISPAQRKRILHSHFGLENVLEFLRANDLSKLKEIHLLHLSNNNADAAEIRRQVAGITGCPVYVAGA